MASYISDRSASLALDEYCENWHAAAAKLEQERFDLIMKHTDRFVSAIEQLISKTIEVPATKTVNNTYNIITTSGSVDEIVNALKSLQVSDDNVTVTKV